jgi:hypothetical protein
MNLLEVRTVAAQMSGRWDLVNPTTFANNGMDFHILSGQKYLDRLITLPDSKANIFFAPIAGSYSITIPSSCRILQEVWASNAEARYVLNKLEPADFKAKYLYPVASTTAEAPVDYAFIDSRSLSADYQDLLAEYLDKPAVDGSGYGYRGIVFGPQFDEQYVIEVIGLFHQVELQTDADTNYWSYAAPNLLLMATMRSIEIFNRNTEGVNDWTASILSELQTMDYDVAEEESFGVDQLEG